MLYNVLKTLDHRKIYITVIKLELFTVLLQLQTNWKWGVEWVLPSHPSNFSILIANVINILKLPNGISTYKVEHLTI
jgi:hypothetical protein